MHTIVKMGWTLTVVIQHHSMNESETDPQQTLFPELLGDIDEDRMAWRRPIETCRNLDVMLDQAT